MCVSVGEGGLEWIQGDLQAALSTCSRPSELVHPQVGPTRRPQRAERVTLEVV